MNANISDTATLETFLRRGARHEASAWVIKKRARNPTSILGFVHEEMSGLALSLRQGAGRILSATNRMRCLPSAAVMPGSCPET